MSYSGVLLTLASDDEIMPFEEHIEQEEAMGDCHAK